MPTLFKTLPHYRLNSDKLVASEESPSGEIRCHIIASNPSQEDRLFLLKVMESVGISSEQFVLYPFTSGSGIRLSTEMALSGKVFLIFGCTSGDLGLSIVDSPYAPYSMYTYSLLFAEELSAIQKNVASKRRLWTALQALFSTDD